MPRAKIQLTMDDADFGYLTENSAEWAAKPGEPDEWEWQIEDGRFETVPIGDKPIGTWKRAYWLGQDYAHVMLAKAFLAAWGHEYQVLVDQDGGWVILTDYEQKQEGE